MATGPLKNTFPSRVLTIQTSLFLVVELDFIPKNHKTKCEQQNIYSSNNSRRAILPPKAYQAEFIGHLIIVEMLASSRFFVVLQNIYSRFIESI